MQTPPPISNLLRQLTTMGSNVSQLKEDSNYDWNWRPDQDDWSLTEVLCHLRDVEGEVHQPRFVAVLERKDPFLPGASADEWAKVRGYRDQDGRAALAAFLLRRQETVNMLKDLTPDTWQRQGTHAYLGRTSLHELLFLVTRHDGIHWEQIKSLLSEQAGDQLKPGN